MKVRTGTWGLRQSGRNEFSDGTPVSAVAYVP
jgi:hypothetical protein